MTEFVVVHPGWVCPEGEDRHFVSFSQLCQLHGVDPMRAHDARSTSGWPADARHLYPET